MKKHGVVLIGLLVVGVGLALLLLKALPEPFWAIVTSGVGVAIVVVGVVIEGSRGQRSDGRLLGGP